MTALNFPRPHGVVAAETERHGAAFLVTLDDPTYRDAVGLAWGWHGTLGEQTLAQLVETASDAQSAFQEAIQARNAVEAQRAWRVMRGALLCVAMRSRQRIGGPFHA